MYSIEIPWHHPVVVRLQNGTDRLFSGTWEALDFLKDEWPTRRGAHYKKAVDICTAALERTVPASVAREAFISSCIEAGLPLTSSRHGNARRPRNAA
jgi:hypothetical protein